MKKIIISLVAAMMAATATFAQSSLLATLSHEGDISTFYGSTALREAYAAAVDGDIITLSSGTFTSVNIEKGITIRGAGMDVDPKTQSEPTIISGNFNVKGSEKPLTIEGIYSNYTITIADTLRNATFLKSRFNTITRNRPCVNLTMIHCKVSTRIAMNNSLSSASCLNCVIFDPWNDGTMEFTNCVICKSAVDWYLPTSTFKNCIFVGYSSNTFAPRNSLYNCVLLSDDTSVTPFSRIPNTTNSVATYAEVFKTCTDGTYSDSEQYELTEAAAAKYLGTDETQVGLYGGSMPFSITPSNPQITKCNVASKSTADGKLSVDITVAGAE